jgi:hypothetical protein
MFQASSYYSDTSSVSKTALNPRSITANKTDSHDESVPVALGADIVPYRTSIQTINKMK